MDERHIQFSFEGPHSKGDAQALVDFLKAEFPDWPSQRVENTASSGHAVVRGDTLDLITLLVSIPGGVLAVWDLSVRLKLKAKIDVLLAWAKERRSHGHANPFVLLPPDNKAVTLDQVAPDKLLDAIAVQAQEFRKGKS